MRNAAACNRVDNTHPDTLAQTFYLRPVTLGFGCLELVAIGERAGFEASRLQVTSSIHASARQKVSKKAKRKRDFFPLRVMAASH